MSSTDYKEPCAGIITDCIFLPLSLLTITLLRDGPSTVKIYRQKWNRVRRGITRFDGCWGSAVVVAMAAVYMAAW